MPVINISKYNSSTKDTYINQYVPTEMNEWQVEIMVGTAGMTSSARRALLHFDLGMLPNDVIINYARLYLNMTNTAAISAPFTIHALTQAFDPSTANWNNQPTYSNTYKSEITNMPNSPGGRQYDITNIVQAWVNGTIPNYGLLIKDTNEGAANTLKRFESAESGGSSQPYLIIDYTIPTTGKRHVEYIGYSTGKASSSTNLSLSLPSGWQVGDLLLAHVTTGNAGDPITGPVGWTKLSDVNANGYLRSAVFWKFAAAGDAGAVFTSPITNWYATMYCFRNVKSVAKTTGQITTTGITLRPPGVTGIPNKSMCVLLNAAIQNIYYTPPLNFQEGFDQVDSNITGAGIGMSYSYTHNKTTLQPADMTTIATSSVSGADSRAVILEAQANKPPTLTLNSPANNQTLSEGNALPIQGTAGDTDNGNVVTVKYKINNGPTRAIASGVSDGSSPISFARTLVYSNKRLWDGSTDVAGVDLAEGVDHTLTVWAEDDQGGKSAEITRKFRVIWNRPPSISGANEDLGTIMVPPTKTYTVTEPEGNPFTITEKINGTVIRSFEGVAGREETVTIPHDLWIRLDLDTPHSLTVEATDSQGLTSTRTFTFVRTETHIEFMLDFDNPDVEAHFTLDGMPKRVLVTLEQYLPPGSSIEFVKVCNNAMDEVPTWEDATAAVSAGRGYLFTNQTKTAASWRINIWISIAKGTATERVRLDGFGGAFD